MAPTQVFLIRHSERMDHVNREFGKTYFRPHDTPLTPHGVSMAEDLGAYLVQHFHVDLANTVVLSSPLTRCVQTANGVINGALRAADDNTQNIPIYLEPAIMEGAYWIFHDMCQNRDIVNPDTKTFNCPDPIYYAALHHRANTSPYVEVVNPFPLYPPPQFAVEKNTLVDPTFPERCEKAARKLPTIPELDGKTVLFVAHGETTLRAMYALHDRVMPPGIRNPAYTAFAQVLFEGSGADAHVTDEMPTFGTPHLPEVPHEY